MAGLLLLLSLTAGADPIVVLDHVDDPAEERLVEELILSGMEVDVEPGPPGFAQRTLPDQLDAVRPLLADHQAVLWLTPEAERLTVAVALVSSSRAVVRVVEAPRDELAIGRLAMASRELVAATRPLEPTRPSPEPSSLPEPEPSPPPEPAPVPARPVTPPTPELSARPASLRPLFRITAGATIPSVSDALGVRGGLDLELGARRGLLEAGASLGFSAGRDQVRFVPRIVGRVSWVTAALAVDVTRLPWATQLQPRLEVGGEARLPHGLTPEFRLRVSLIRDVVELDEQRLYSSGWVEFGIHFGFQRQIGRRSSHDGVW